MTTLTIILLWIACWILALVNIGIYNKHHMIKTKPSQINFLLISILWSPGFLTVTIGIYLFYLLENMFNEDSKINITLARWYNKVFNIKDDF